MKNNKEDVDADIALFLSQENSLGLADKRTLLRAMFDKHLVLQTSDLILNRFDFNQIISNTVSAYSRDALPSSIGNQTLDQNEVRNMVIMETFASFLNSKGALKRLPKFDRKKNG